MNGVGFSATGFFTALIDSGRGAPRLRLGTLSNRAREDAESASRRTDTDRGPDQYRRPAVTCRPFATDLGLPISAAAADAASAATGDAAAAAAAAVGRALTTTAMMGTRTILEEAVERSAAANVVAYGGERQWTRDATDDENRALRGDVIDFLSRRLTPGAANTSGWRGQARGPSSRGSLAKKPTESERDAADSSVHNFCDIQTPIIRKSGAGNFASSIVRGRLQLLITTDETRYCCRTSGAAISAMSADK